MKNKKAQLVFRVIRSFDQLENNPDLEKIKTCVESSVYKGVPVQLVMFTCSTINDKYLFDKKIPWKYVSLDPTGNNLEGDCNTIKLLIEKISLVYPVRLTVIIGNTDPYYIYSESFRNFPKSEKVYLWKKFSSRWAAYERKFSEWLVEKKITNFDVVSSYEFEVQLYKNLGIKFEQMFDMLLPTIEKYFSLNDFESELAKLEAAFGPGKYFPTQPPPETEVLRSWTRRKFTEYMLQGFLIFIFFPNAILLQNEKPSLLRQKMYQPLIKKYFNNVLPNLFPFGVDNNEYQ